MVAAAHSLYGHDGERGGQGAKDDGQEELDGYRHLAELGDTPDGGDGTGDGLGHDGGGEDDYPAQQHSADAHSDSSCFVSIR